MWILTHSRLAELFQLRCILVSMAHSASHPVGLTEDHPTLTTYFEGEIIGSKYSFLTQHEDWGSTDKVDLQHWAKFSAFRPFQKQAKKRQIYIQYLAKRDNILMR